MVANGQQQQWLIIGLGITGLSVARYLAAQGITFAVADTRLHPPGLEELELHWPDVDIWLGPLDASLTCSMSTLVVSPGVSVSEPAIVAARAAGVAVIGDVELFCQAVTVPVIAITGSNAKSTVTTLVGQMAARAGLHVGVGGNIGLPVLDLLQQGPHDCYVLELSSFQLETTLSLQAKASVILNISEDHLDRYASMEDYQLAKQRIHHRSQCVIFNRDDDQTLPLHNRKAPQLSFGLSAPATAHELGLVVHSGARWLARGEQLLMPTTAVPLAGEHGLANALAALALGYAAGWPDQPMCDAIRDFEALPHRCQRVAERGGATWYNDSKATNVGATLAAVRGLQQPDRALWLILGGEGKGQDFSPFQTGLSNVRGVALIGRDAVIIAEHLPGHLHVEPCGTLPEAVNWLATQVAPGDQVLLSPACASFDQFKGFAHRGEVFSQCVNNLPA
ncbi:UDP-N-acetylmuramoyl-L-alanine--D-glutamate ligase [Marinospirillum alkaliphilum]|uniref:UDP-N-acetylmuramoylalanine--D-glutamate ligase n=1 Tax=Marinospirillum alkaliphilum DSM 21637 TaxID=1122209 RepID=A0A1K1TRE2_9GAMM|nr:UDP-N-acetylmuramoyl-L-alanine--D-glutamate ligase [Marinospirillum alkaliphilum]SFX03110.1 UDP-N-acetylmuramoylalanine--D-glutamate ligase [Marinospirillum alkaliphilum DSM 21637]